MAVPCSSPRFCVSSGRAVTIRGWLGGVPPVGRAVSPPRGALVLRSDDGVWHVEIARWQWRPELLRGMLGTSRSRRRVVRFVDRLPAPLRTAVLRAWARGADRVAFEVLLDLARFPPGDYRLDLLEMNRAGSRTATTDHVIVVTA